MDSDTAVVDSPADFGESDRGIAARWISEIDLAEKDPEYQKWLKRCRKIIKLYKEDRPETTNRKRFALFWSNIETLKPAVYANTPTAVIGRRWKSADSIGRVASEILERAVNYSIEAYDFSAVMEAVRDDQLLVGLGTAWVRYIPTFQAKDSAGDPGDEPDGDGQVSDDAVPGEVVTWEEVRADHVNWEDFGHTPARSWDEVRAVWRRAFMTRDELVDRFGDEKGKACPLDWCPKGHEDSRDEQFKKAAIYEIWDKSAKEVIWICKSYTQSYLDRKEDMLQLDTFFPCPKPVFGTIANSLIPVPDYVYYQDQVEEIDELTGRIHLLLEALKVRGFYAASEKDDLNTLLRTETNVLIPVDSWAALRDNGGIKGLIEWFPLEVIVTTLKGCFDARKQIIDDVYQVTGISDIMRGDTDPDETATAQGIKNNWGSSRVRDRQKELARFARDIIRLMAQVICNQFDPQILGEMTDTQLMTNAEKAQVQQEIQLQQQQAQLLAPHQQMMQAQGSAPPQIAGPPQTPSGAAGASQPPPPQQAPPQTPQIPPQMQDQLSQPSWEDVMNVLQNKALRSFRIDIETDSTIEPNDQEEKQRRIEFVTAVGEYLAKSLPVVQASPVMLPIIAEGLKFLVRGFRVGREMEDVIDRAMDQLEQGAGGVPQQTQPKGPDPQAQQMQAQAALIKAHADAGSVQVDQGHLQIEAQRAAAEHQAAMAGIQAENYRTHVDATVDLHGINTDANIQQVIQKANEKRLTNQIVNPHPIQANTR